MSEILRSHVKQVESGKVERIAVPGKWIVNKEPDGTIRIQILS
jgi:hypothetical protein